MLSRHKNFIFCLIGFFLICQWYNFNQYRKNDNNFEWPLEINKNNLKNIYFVKTHKTASSALQNVLIRLADKRKMRVVTNLQKEIIINSSFGLNDKIYFIHGRHNTQIAEKAFPRNNSLYMTILRKPADQLLSSLNYFRMLKGKRTTIYNNIEDERTMKKLASKNKILCLLRNSASYDLGIVNCAESYKGSEQSLINRFKKEFDFVILTEYFNEGLILLKKMLNLSYKDIVCLSVNQGTKKVDEKDREWAESVIEKVSNADVILYNYYLKKYEEVRVLLKDEVDELKRQNDYYQNECTNGREQKYFYGDVPYIGYSLRTNLTGDFKDFCVKLTSTELELTNDLLKKQLDIFSGSGNGHLREKKIRESSCSCTGSLGKPQGSSEWRKPSFKPSSLKKINLIFSLKIFE
ncbi:galactosylceramide sulfotransferase-like [Brachionus plicatilis]|uniref:Galactosylceramide sulfotransferase-like n=1 Tax=Brachionus plicatilis TaxID=10195 RepID=A0A3M7SKZ8_BRAPC|nr:galactosylceramide sulfotransferase-like [Brachionus plicatilis]